MDDDEKKDEEEKPKRETRQKKETVKEWERINENKAIWLRSKDDIEDDEYKSFYKSFTKDYDDPMNWIHFKAEGEVNFNSLLFIPKRAPHDLFENYHASRTNLKLFVKRVLINEEFDELMPKYLNFVRGVVDSDELPLNVSRESI